MGRTRTKAKVAPPKGRDPLVAPIPSSRTPAVSALLQKAQELIVECDYELAQKFVTRILQQQPDHAAAKEILGVAQLETGELESAKETFLSLIPPHPGAPVPPPPSAYLYLAQLSDDDPNVALQHYQAAVEILTSQLKGKDRAIGNASREDDDEIKSNIVRALIGQVEIWMDPSYDLCFDPNADNVCENLLQLALQTDPGNSEALQALSSVRMSQQRPEEAKECLEKAWEAWKDLDPDDPKLPPIPNRLALVKLFLELFLFTPALLVLHGIMSSDDQDVEAWYLEGWCFFMMSERAQEQDGSLDGLTWQELAKDARDCLETCQVLHENQEHPDAPLLAHTRELIQKLDEQGIKPSPPEEGEGDWEDVGEESDESDVDME